MKNLIRLSLVTGLLLTISLVFGQKLQTKEKHHQGTPPPIPNAEQIDKMVNELTEVLSLSTEQKETIHQKFTQHFEIVKQKQNEMKKLRADFENDLKTVLTKEQQQKFDDFTKQKEIERRAHKSGKRPPKKQK